MVCDRCGGTHRGALPGMVLDSCTVESVPAHRTLGEPVLERRTMPAGAGAVLSLCLLALGVTLLATAGGDGDGERADDARPVVDDIAPGGMPQRIGPTFFPEDVPEPSATSAKPTPRPAAEKPKPPASAPAPRPVPSGSRADVPAGEAAWFSEWAGPGCPNGVRTHGRYRDGRDGWYEVGSGGHRGNGCDGRFIAVPMSGARERDGGNTVTWNWHPGSGYSTCSVAVRVPWSHREEDVAGDPTRYHVLADVRDSGSVLAAFEIGQRAMRGGVVVVNDLPVREGELTVQLVDRGRDWGYGGRGGAHHAAAQIRADCRS
ncbi:adhesin [Streptomyces sp. HNM0645]|uniref:adhesin n=1 Tax=Streptomyces sp. HNM0645 TaxID=2782343 RepID=UPI0024B7557E|nr:adhesin [Streptomyces sp. HNM0645]MDI9886883.1 adhesin [Streptomyces sp. HNM0645]